MLESLKRAMSGADVVPKTALDALQAEFDSHKADANALLEAADEANQELKAQLEAVLAQVEELKQFAEAAEAEKARLAAEAEAARLAARKEKIVAAVGEGERADALMAATKALEDAAFAAVVAAVTTSTVVEAKSPMFNEVGVAAEVDATKVEETSNETMRLLQEKYAPK